MSEPPWLADVRALAARAPDWMRERACTELEVDVIRTRLDTPVLEVADLPAEAAARALTFFLAVCLASGAPVARVLCGHTPGEADLSRHARRALGRALARLEDENAALMGYFDVHLRPPSAVGPRTAAALVRRLREAVDET